MRSPRCKVTLNADLAYKTALQHHQEKICCRSDGQLLTLVYVLNMEIYVILLVVQTVLHLIHPIYFKSYLFHCIPQLYLLSFTVSSVGGVCSMPQYFKQELFFSLIFLDPGTKTTPLGSKCDKKTFTTTQNTKLLHILCTSDNYCLLWHYSLTTVLVFHQEENWLCWKRVMNYKVRSAIFWDLIVADHFSIVGGFLASFASSVWQRMFRNRY